MKLMLMCIMVIMIDGVVHGIPPSKKKSSRGIPVNDFPISHPLPPLPPRMVNIRPPPPQPSELPPPPPPLTGHLIVKGPSQYYSEFDEPRDYHFNYLLDDDYTGNYQTREETKDGNTVIGSYSLREPTGAIRHVRYIADKYGFRAFVQREWPDGHRI